MLTSKQEAYKNARITGKDPSAAYRLAYNAENMNPHSVQDAAYHLEIHPVIGPMIADARLAAQERSGVSRDEIIDGLRLETLGTRGADRIAAWDKLAKIAGIYRPEGGSKPVQITQVTVNLNRGQVVEGVVVDEV